MPFCIQLPGKPVLAPNALCGWSVQPVADIRASITFLFGMFIFVKCFIIIFFMSSELQKSKEFAP